MEQNLKPMTEEKCAYGDREHAAEKFMSGTPICWAHWNWLKLDLPAADHWAKVAEAFLSNVDAYDLMKYFPAAGLDDEDARIMLASARALLDFSKKVQQGAKGFRDE